MRNINENLGGELQGKTETIGKTDILAKKNPETIKHAIITDVNHKENESKKKTKEDKKENFMMGLNVTGKNDGKVPQMETEKKEVKTEITGSVETDIRKIKRDESENNTCKNENKEKVYNTELKHDLDDMNLDITGHSKGHQPTVESQTKNDNLVSMEEPIPKSESTQIPSSLSDVECSILPHTMSQMEKKKVSFQIHNIDTDTSNDALVIDEEIIPTDGQDNGNLGFLDDFMKEGMNLLDEEDDDTYIPCSQIVSKDQYVKSANFEDKDNHSPYDSVSEDPVKCHGLCDNLYGDDEEREPDSSSRCEDSENEDVSKQWIHYKEGHVLEK